jgi:hypothetical protein
MQLYGQVVLSDVKEHISSIIRSFNLDAPTGYASFPKLIAFQTGHTIRTHSGSYALNENYPAKLLPDLGSNAPWVQCWEWIQQFVQ